MKLTVVPMFSPLEQLEEAGAVDGQPVEFELERVEVAGRVGVGVDPRHDDVGQDSLNMDRR